MKKSKFILGVVAAVMAIAMTGCENGLKLDDAENRLSMQKNISIPAPVWSNSLSELTDDIEIVGAGSFVDDDTFGKVFKNVGGGLRANYLKLPGDLFTYSADSKEMTIAFWVKGVPDVNWHPLFMSYNSENLPASATPFPFFTLQSRLTAQINCEGFCDFGAAYSTNGDILESNAFLNDDKWHFYTCTFNSTELKIYVDGVVQNSWKIDGTSEGQKISGVFGNTNLNYTCLGGMQNFEWADNDAPFSFAKISIFNEMFTEEQVKKLIEEK